MVYSDRMRIKLRSFDSKSLDVSMKLIVDAAKKSGSTIAGPIPLPTKIKKYTVLKSPHVNIKAREQFEMRIYSRILDIYDMSKQAMGILTGIELPSGIDIEIKQ